MWVHWTFIHSWGNKAQNLSYSRYLWWLAIAKNIQDMMDISRSGTGERYSSKHRECGHTPQNGQIRPLPGRVRFACCESPKPLWRTETATTEIMRMQRCIFVRVILKNLPQSTETREWQKSGVRRRKSNSQLHWKHRLFSWVSERGKVFISVPPKMEVTLST